MCVRVVTSTCVPLTSDSRAISPDHIVVGKEEKEKTTDHHAMFAENVACMRAALGLLPMCVVPPV